MVMKDARSHLVKILHRSFRGEGVQASPVPGVYCIKVSHPGRRNKDHWRASLGLIVQGCKEIVLGRRSHRIDEGHYIATPIDLPVISRIAAATPEKPFLALLIGLDPRTLNEVSAPLGTDMMERPEAAQRALFVGKPGDAMLEAAVRLGRLFESPADAPVLGGLIIREMLYHLLKGSDGPAIRRLVCSDSRLHRIVQSIHGLRSELGEAADVAALAKTANMSRSAFFKHFKEVTAMSPIQYQKRLRLLEARRLMIDEGETAEGSAFKVGYASASQFSREYARMFGSPPLRDALKGRSLAVA
ncbi:MAG: AraC family transcriptional regulator [Verrucomicrobiota bacterium]